MTEIVRVKSAPGLKWKKRRNDVFEARWQCRDDIVERGYKIKSVKLWSGTGDPTKEEWDFIADTCNQLQQEMLVWSRGGLPSAVPFDGTISGLIHCFRTDADSSYKKVRYASRIHYDALMSLIEREHGSKIISDLKGRTLRHWHDTWSSTGKVAVAHAKMKMLRGLLVFGSTMLEDEFCIKISSLLSQMKFRMPKPRVERLTAEQVVAIRAMAREMGRPSISLEQAFQFEGMFRQKDGIGEYVPVSEPGMSDVIHKGYKWLRGIRWEAIDANMVLTHITSKRQKEIKIDLRNAPMVMEELGLLVGVAPEKVTRDMLPASGPIVVSEYDGLPWDATEFRRWWRQIADACGIPKAVRNMDSRAGAITEASDAGADLEHIRHAATHSDIAMTQRYSRGAEEKIAGVQLSRIAHRNKPRTE